MNPVLVTIPEVPARPFLEMLDHVRTLVREFALIRGGLETGTSTPDLPGELIGLLDRMLVQYDAEAELLRAAAAEAVAAGRETFEVRVELPLEAREAALSFLAAVEQIDELARDGSVLLTPPSSPELAEFRRWYVGRMVAVLEDGGRTPVD